MENEFIHSARKTIRQEAEALHSFASGMDLNFAKACETILGCQGTVVLTGMGKSGLVARKWASTFISTGTRSYFLNPAEASHGDLGILQSDDVLIVLSSSGETDEIRPVLNYAAEKKIACIAVTQNGESALGRSCSVLLCVSVKEEACPLGLAPTTSTTLMMALGDALAVALMEKRGFSEKEFARLHPGGALGRRLWLRVSQLMHTGDKIPLVDKSASLKEVLLEMTQKCLGLAVIQERGRAWGIITDGDLRRAFQSRGMDETMRAEDLANREPKSIAQSALAVEAAKWMAASSIQQLLVESESGELVGVVHLYDLLQAKVV
jgi:arabinose-5-phosphate isomerase